MECPTKTKSGLGKKIDNNYPVANFIVCNGSSIISTCEFNVKQKMPRNERTKNKTKQFSKK